MLRRMSRTLLPALVLTSFLGCATAPDYGRPLAEGEAALIPIDPDEMPDFTSEWEEREALYGALDLSLDWMHRRHAPSFYPMAGITHERALRSLERLREILATSASAAEMQQAIESEFTVYKSAGWDGEGGGVMFTAYCTPILRGSLEPSAEFAHPLYGLPADLVKDKDGTVLGWDTAFGRMPLYPSRGAIEAGMLKGKGLELAWLADPLDAYIAHVNGSAFIELPDSTLYRVGYAGKNGQAYTSLGRELEADGVIPKGTASLRTIREWAASASQEDLDDYLGRNASYVFFTPIEGNPHGSLDVEVTEGRSIATDKTLFPRAAPVFVSAFDTPDGPQTDKGFHRFFLDQDTGGAIRTAGRADLYLGIGPEAEERAGGTKLVGQMFYLFLKE
jgi:membrane-bound lytic murein transglycosylase A